MASKQMTLVESIRMEAALCAQVVGHGGESSSEWIQAIGLIGRKFAAAADEIERLGAYIEGMAGGAETGASHAWFKSMAKSALAGEPILVGEMGKLRRLGPTSGPETEAKPSREAP